MQKNRLKRLTPTGLGGHTCSTAPELMATDLVPICGFSLHAEYINRPATVNIDPTGEVRFIYQRTFWIDRPTIEQILDMIKNKTFEFKHEKRLNNEN